MKFLISVFLGFYCSAKSLNHGEALLYEELKNEKILVKDSLQYPGFSDFITLDGKVSITKRKMSRKKFQNWIQQDKTIFLSQFEPNASPYAGPISNQIECAKNLKPKPLFMGGRDKKKGGNSILESFIYKSNNRFVALSCQNKGDSIYDSAYIAIHCTHFGYKIKIHKRNKLKEVNNTKLLKAINAFSCLAHKL